MANPSTSPGPHPGPAKPRSLRTFNRIGCLLLIVVLVTFLVVSYFAKTSAGGRRLQEEIARLKAAGVLLEPEDLIPSVPAGEKNAADVHEQAFRAYHVSQSESETVWQAPEEDPSRMDTVRDVVARHARYFDLLDEASRVPACAFPVDWREPVSATFPDHTNMREAARMLVLRAEVLSADGDYDGALECCATGFRIAEHVKIEPSLRSQLVAYAIQSITLGSLADGLSAGTPSAEACRRLFDQLSTIDQIVPSVHAMQGELAFEGMYVFELAHGGRVHVLATTLTDLSERELAAYVTIGRPLLNADHITYLRHMEKRIAGYALAYREIGSEFEDAQAVLDRAPYTSLLTGTLTWASLDAMVITGREENAALIRCAQAALAVKAYSAAHGSYPESLPELEADGWALPRDSFTFPEAPLHYHRRPEGFQIWSVGPDGDNDGGLTEWDRRKAVAPGSQQRMVPSRDYDVTFRCQQ